MTKELTTILIGIPALLARASDFEKIFSAVAAPATGRWPGLLIWMERHPLLEPWGILIERNSDFVAAAIFTRYRRFGVWCIGKPGYTSDQIRFGAVDDDAAVKLAQGISTAVISFGGPWKLDVSGLPSPDPVVNHLLSIWSYSQTHLAHSIPALIFAPNAPLSTYLSRNTRAAVAKAQNRIQREGIEMIQEWTQDPTRILKYLPQIQSICRLRDYQKYGKSLMDDFEEESYWMAFMKEHTRLGLIDLLTIHFNVKLAAFALCLTINDEYLVLTNRASPEWLRYSPGTIANAEVVRHTFEDVHSKGVNWGAGIQRYKLSGNITLIPLQTLSAWSSETLRLLSMLGQTLRVLAHRLDHD